MLRERKLQKLDEYLEENSTWLEWGINWALKKPAGWTLNTFVKKPMSWTYQKLIGSEETKTETSVELVVKEVLQVCELLEIYFIITKKKREEYLVFH